MEKIEIMLNGQPFRVEAGMTLGELAAIRGWDKSGGVAISINDIVMRRYNWNRRILVRGDRVLVLTAAQGG